jgi:5-methylcytosine-specific restriction enzyme A
MTRSSTNRIAESLTRTFGLRFSVRASNGTEGPVIWIAPDDLVPTEGFGIRVTLAWRHLRAEFVPGSFARPLIAEMAEANEEGKARSAAFARGGRQAGLAVEMSVNQLPANPTDPDSWPDRWDSFTLGATLPQVTVEPSDEDEVVEQTLRLSEPVMGLVLSLLPVDDSEEEGVELAGLPEGGVMRIEVNRYERNRLNRAACIAYRGATCAVCDFDFELVYGAIGAGFIHVHHVTPVSHLGPGYRLDPIRDLIPVCPNCHSMLHRKNPPMRVEDLRKEIKYGLEISRPRP